MVRLATVANSFHARVIAARLGAEGMVIELRGNVDGLYPMGVVHVYVGEDDLGAANELLLVDEVEAAFVGVEEEGETAAPRRLWMVLAAMVLLAAVVFSRSF